MMKILHFFAFIFAWNYSFAENSITTVQVNITGQKIVGGKVIPLSDAPYQVSIQYKSRHDCGGSIISPNFIITAAHCVFLKPTKDLSVRVGTDTVEKGGEVYTVKRIRNHPRFNPFTFNFDFALLELSMDITMQPGISEMIKLSSKDDEAGDGTDALVSGWGRTQKADEPRDVLRGVIVPLVSQKECKKAYDKIAGITNQMICAGDLTKGGRDSCQGKNIFTRSFNV
jgi:trypsin